MTDVGLTRADEEALLGRPVRPLLTAADRHAFEGQRCLVTGAGGSIGSELARQLAACAPAQLTLLDNSERQLFEIERELVERWPGVRLEPVLADVTRPAMMQAACGRGRPDVVFHAAAYKHVTMAERAVCATVNANIIGTAVTLNAAQSVEARFVQVSTDKAAAPSSLMGATKRFAELVAVAASRPGLPTAVVRFGNVLASSGSFVTIVQDRIRRRRPIPITNPEATRYFMTASEAASLVMKADTLARGGEVFWLDMGEPVRIGDLVDRILALAAAQGYAPVPLDVIGMRAGEKQIEQLTTAGLAMRRTSDPRIWVAHQAAPSTTELSTALKELRQHVDGADGLAALRTLTRIVLDYQPSLDVRTAASAEHEWFRAGMERARLLSA